MASNIEDTLVVEQGFIVFNDTKKEIPYFYYDGYYIQLPKVVPNDFTQLKVIYSLDASISCAKLMEIYEKLVKPPVTDDNYAALYYLIKDYWEMVNGRKI